ncbi:csdA Selenocysteine lyase/Cysteine desulfurase [Candidatus Pelagibacterales bacterium]
MNLKDIKSQFPIFKFNKNLIYFDTANSAQKPKQVIDALEDFYKNHYANIGRAVYGLAARATHNYEGTRETIKEFVNGTEGEIVFTKNSTESLNLVAHCFGKFLKEGDEIILTEAEHHSNYVPWHFLRKKKVNIKFIPINEDGVVEVNKLTSLITNKTKIISIIHISNVTGLTTDIKKVISIAKAKKIPVCIDGTQAVAHTDVDLKELDCDFYAFSSHKIYGPTGVGILYMKNKWIEQFDPFIGGGGMIQNVDTKNITYASGVSKFEAGSLASAEVIALKQAVEFVKDIKIKNIISHEQSLASYALDKISKFNDVEFVGSPSNKGSVFSFNIKGVHAHDASTVFDEDDIAVRAGHHCCQILHKKMKIGSSLRMSFGVYNNKQDIDAICESIKKCKKIFKL